MNLRNRTTLKRNFSKGRLLSETDFADLIDSTVNKIDDGFSKDEKNGLQLSPSVDSDRVMSIFNHFTDQEPLWHLSLERDNEDKMLSIHGPDLRNHADKFLSFHENGNLGVNTRKPEFDLEVNGMAAMKGRVGTYARGIQDGDGTWHSIVQIVPKETAQLSDHLNAFEIVAFIGGKDGVAQYAGLYATALRVFNRRKIRMIRVNTGWFRNRLSVRWKRNKGIGSNKQDTWLLQIRTLRPYTRDRDGDGQYPKIHYHVTQLFSLGNNR